MFKTKNYQNANELVRDPSDDPKFAADLESHIEDRRLVRCLFALRCAAKLSQAEIAARMGCKQAKISKLEASKDDDVNLGDIKGYARALGFATILGFESGPKAVARIKYHAACISAQVTKLAKLGRTDTAIAEGVAKFFSQSAFELLKILESGTKELRTELQPHGVIVEIVGPNALDCETSEEGVSQEPSASVEAAPKTRRRKPQPA